MKEALDTRIVESNCVGCRRIPISVRSTPGNYHFIYYISSRSVSPSIVCNFTIEIPFVIEELSSVEIQIHSY